ncbi:MAG: formate dehydrogenase subunit gamma [Acidobacteriota bacterium]
MSEKDNALKRAAAEQLERAHGLSPEEAAKRAAAMHERLARRFGKWVRRELAIQTSTERRGSRERHGAQPAAPIAGPATFQRFSLNIRLQHAVMAVSVVLLILTGIPLKFNEHAWAKAIIGFFGGPDVSPIVHRVAAALLIAMGLWHVFYIAFTREGRSNFMQLLPRPKDALDAFQQIKYYLGLADARPRFDRFSYVEKFDYWAVYWGMVIMIGSGLMLWFTEFVLRFMPKWVTDIAKEAHSDEALLATLAIVIWHFYNVHFNPHQFPMNRTFIHGRLSAREMVEEHPLEWERHLAELRAAGEDVDGPTRADEGGGEAGT